MIEQLPLVNLLLLLTMALMIPLFRKRQFKTTLILGFCALFVVFVISALVLNHVHHHGEIRYVFGLHTSALGIELLVDSFSALFTFLIVAIALVIYVYSCGDATDGIEEKEYGRYYILLFILLFSMFGILYTNDLFNTYVFMEILSITTCAIISIKRKKENYTSSFRYVMLNEIGSLSYLFGVALLYMVTGYTNIDLVSGQITTLWTLYPANIMTAVVFMVAGVSIKAAIFPLHIWLPDAHSSAPNSSSALLSAVVVKVYILVLVKVLFRVFGADVSIALNIPLIITLIGATGIIMGSIFALAQKDVKRMLGYSSVAQIGYIVLGISLMSIAGLHAAMFHIVSHALMKAALFLSAGMVIYHKRIRSVDGFVGMAYEMPVAMTVFGISALGMIGIPLTSGFVAKYNLGIAAISAGHGILLVVIVLSSVLNAMYYLPILIAAFLKGDRTNRVRMEKMPKTMLVPVALLGALVIFLGVYPDVLSGLFEAAIRSLP